MGKVTLSFSHTNLFKLARRAWSLCAGACRVITSCNPWSTKAKSKLCSRMSKRLAWGSLLTVLTTKIQPSKPQVREEYTTSFMHIFGTNKVPQVVLWFLWAGTYLGQNWNQRATRARHDRTTRHDRPCRCGRPCQVRLHLPCGTPLVQHTSSPVGTTWMNEIDQGNVSLIEWMRVGSLGSMGPLVRPINRHNRHSKAILGVPERRRFRAKPAQGTDPQPP
jgi:hypothetical protein